MADPYDLQRFVIAQDEVDPFKATSVYEVAVSELSAGRKASHWMWFVFPQLKSLGRSTRAIYYGINSREEAVGYLRHDVLGLRLRECAQLVRDNRAVTATALMGDIDELKLQSSMTLFAEMDDDPADFVAVLRRYYDGERDVETLTLLEVSVVT